MSYEELVELYAISQLNGNPVVLTDEMAEVFAQNPDKEKFSTDVEAAMERIKAERASHIANNTLEYQKAKGAYGELVAKYAELLLNAGKSLMGINPEDEIALEECAKYGVDVSHFYEDISKAAHSEIAEKPREIDSNESTMKM